MAIPVIETTTEIQPNGPTDTLAMTKPTGLAEDDLDLMLCGNDWGTDNVLQFNTVSGYTRDKNVGNDTADCQAAMYSAIADGLEGASQDVTTLDASRSLIGLRLRVSGVDASPIEVLGTEAFGPFNTSLVIPEITTLTDDSLACFIMMYDGGDAAGEFSTSSTGWSIFTDFQEPPAGAGNGVTLCFGTKDMATKGLTGDCTIDWTTQDGAIGFQFAIKPGAISSISDINYTGTGRGISRGVARGIG